MLRDLVQDIRVAARAFSTRPGFFAVAILTVALAIGANAVVFGVTRGIVLQPLPYHEPDRLVSVWPGNFFSYREVEFLREHMNTASGVGAWVPGWSMTLTGDGDPLKLQGARVTAHLFEVLGVAPATGRSLTATDEVPGASNVVLLSASLWRGAFGADPAIAGRSITLDGSSHTVLGVMPATFELYQPGTQAWRVLDRNPEEWYYRGGGLFAIARLREGATVEQARSELRILTGRMREEFGLPDAYGADADVRPLHEWLVGPVRPTLLVAGGAVILVLLLAGANLANLLLARAAGREREIAIRAALGASRGRLVRQLLAESSVLCAVGGALGLLLALWGLPLATGALPPGTPLARNVHLDATVLIASVLLMLGTAIAFGLIPALTTVRPDAQRALRGSTAAPGLVGWRTRGTLVALQVALGMVLLTGAGLMIQTLWRLKSVDPGFNLAGVLTLEVQPTGAQFRSGAQRIAYYREVTDRVGALPGVRHVGAIQHLPLTGSGWGTDLELDGRPTALGETPPRAAWRIVGGDYARAMGIPLVAGRWFDPADRADGAPVAVVNRTMAEQWWPGESPIGRRVRAGNATMGAWATIVGVVGDVRHYALDADPVPELYQPFAQNPMGGMTLVLRTDGEPAALAPPAIDAVWSIDRDVPITSVRTMADVASASIDARRTMLGLLAAFALVGLVLGIAGTYGVVSHHVASRTREIGIRMALGAEARSVVGSSLAQGLRLALAGIVVGAAGTLLLGRWLGTFLFDVGTRDPVTILAVAVLLFTVTGLASWAPARRAARIDPMEALRHE